MREKELEWCERINPSIGLMWNGFCPKDMIEANRYLYDHELIFFNSGTSRIVTEKNSWHCVKGDIIIIPPNMMHWSQCLTDKVERYCVHFDFKSGLPRTTPPYVFVGREKFIPAQSKPAPNWIPLEFPFFRRLKDSDSTMELIKALFNIKENSSSKVLKKKALFLELLSLLIKETDDAASGEVVTKSMRTVLRVKGFIDNNYKKEIQVNDLSDAFQLTTSHLCRSFRENLGVTPTKYIRKLRIHEAERLICETNLSIAEISYAVGFNDPNYFARVFRERYGFAPSNHPVRVH